MTKLTRDQILSAEDDDRQEVEIPEWGGSVIVKVMNGKRRSKVLASSVVDGNVRLDMLYEFLVIECTVDEEDNPLFTAGDIDTLFSKSGKALHRIIKVAMDINGLSDEVSKN